MTKVAKLFEEEKIEYANKKLNKRNLEFAKTLLDENVDISIIMKSTGLKKAEILELKDKPAETQSFYENGEINIRYVYEIDDILDAIKITNYPSDDFMNTVYVKNTIIKYVNERNRIRNRYRKRPVEARYTF